MEHYRCSWKQAAHNCWRLERTHFRASLTPKALEMSGHAELAKVRREAGLRPEIYADTQPFRYARIDQFPNDMLPRRTFSFLEAQDAVQLPADASAAHRPRATHAKSPKRIEALLADFRCDQGCAILCSERIRLELWTASEFERNLTLITNPAATLNEEAPGRPARVHQAVLRPESLLRM